MPISLVKSEISRQRTAVHPERQRRPGRAEASVRVMALPWRLHDGSLPDGVGQVLFQETPDVVVLTQINRTPDHKSIIARLGCNRPRGRRVRARR